MLDKHLLTRVQNRMTFLYLEKAKLHCHQGAVIAETEQGTFTLPIGSVLTLFLSYGTSITHDAIALLSDSGCSLIWVGDHIFKTYTYGEPLSGSDKMILKQAQAVTNQQNHLAIARKMYQMRFPDEDFTGISIAKMRGKEGVHMKQMYQKYADQYHVVWHGRNYDPKDYLASDPINQALTSANQMLYGICTGVVLALGFSPALGFIHVGTNKAFIYDLSDLYKAKITIPVTFKTINESGSNFYKTLRTNLYQEMQKQNLLEQIVKDLFDLFDITKPDLIITLSLWDNIKDLQQSGIQYQGRR